MSDASSAPKTVGMIFVMGVTGAGKSHFINQLSERPMVSESDGLNSRELTTPGPVGSSAGYVSLM